MSSEPQQTSESPLEGYLLSQTLLMLCIPIGWSITYSRLKQLDEVTALNSKHRTVPKDQFWEEVDKMSVETKKLEEWTGLQRDFQAMRRKQMHSLTSDKLKLNSFYTESTNPSASKLSVCRRKNATKALECLIFGYIRVSAENEYNLNVPHYLKALCFTFYGFVCMQSDILSVNQMNTAQYALSESLHSKPTHLFAQKIYDSKRNGFGSEEFDKKCGIFDYESIIVAKTDQNHIFCSYLSKNFIRRKFFKSAAPKECDELIFVGCLLSSATPTLPFSRNHSNQIECIYHFPKDFEVNRKQKLSDIVIHDADKLVAASECDQFPWSKGGIRISEFEIFVLD